MKMTFVAHAAALATATLCRWPPESLNTSAFGRIWTPRRDIASRARRAIAARSRTPRRPSSPGLKTSRPRKRLLAASRSGASARSWYTVSMPAARASWGLLNNTGSPFTRISPLFGRSVPDRIRTSVLLPAPLSPISATISPRLTWKSAPCRACTEPKWRAMLLASIRGRSGIRCCTGSLNHLSGPHAASAWATWNGAGRWVAGRLRSSRQRARSTCPCRRPSALRDRTDCPW